MSWFLLGCAIALCISATLWFFWTTTRD